MTAITCHKCDATTFSRSEARVTSKVHYFDTETDNHDWKHTDGELTDSGPWECTNGHVASDHNEEELLG